MRKQLLLSTGIICLMLAPAVSYGQGPGARGEEQKQMRPAETGKGATSQERGAERTQERAKGAEQRTQGAAGREEKGAGSRQTEERGKAAPSGERPATAADDKRGRGDDARSRERAQDSRQGSRQGGRDAQTAREGKDAKDRGKGGAEMTREDARGKSTAEQEKSKEGTTSAQKEREGMTTTQKEQGRDQRDSSKDAAERGKDAERPSTATDTTRTQPSGQTTQSQTTQTQTSQQSNISVDKQVRISETMTRERLAPPERNLNISIRVGERIPERVRVRRLPDTIVSIEPAYRGYDYFTTEEEIVIVEPRTKRIVSQVPRDASRIRAAGGETGTGTTSGIAGYTGTTAAASGASPCRIMRRDTAGNLTELTPQTVGSTAAQQDTISVTVRVPGGASTAPIALGAADGQIVVSGQSGADCMVTIEPQPR
ncbi:DUF1236 domain-containing protein [Bradyrhizobium sp. WSM 1738]|uniref:DUF1236 domain-containing protein n=1 Tax=Bradyrhizobium hereditatis TaxID=2821405 RepID=UPI001CE385CA|nr:DUF1236 domain-containing protein [Bradyrhizobium hereditatis]MCA6119436.1 DUF1236 domain-containing protein [Bradyrhizobium hereditatis]